MNEVINERVSWSFLKYLWSLCEIKSSESGEVVDDWRTDKELDNRVKEEIRKEIRPRKEILSLISHESSFDWNGIVCLLPFLCLSSPSQPTSSVVYLRQHLFSSWLCLLTACYCLCGKTDLERGIILTHSLRTIEQQSMEKENIASLWERSVSGEKQESMEAT